MRRPVLGLTLGGGVNDRVMMRASVLAALAAAALAAGCSWGGDADRAGGERRPDAVVLTLANHEDSSLDLDEFALAVRRESQGSLRIEFKNRWRESEVDYEPRTIEDVRDGQADLAKVSARAFDVVGVESLQPLVAPFAVDSYALQRQVLLSGIRARMLGGVERLDLVGIALLPGELRKPLGVSRPLIGASDYRGATIATRRSELGEGTFRVLGASGEVVVPGSDVSAFDGAEIGLDGLQGEDYDGPPRTLAANVSLWPRALTIVMNLDAYERLSAAQQAALRAAGRAAVDPAMKRVQQFEREALGIICRRGEPALRLATPSELGALRSATSSLTRALERDPATRDVARRIAALRARVEPEPAPTCSPRKRGGVARGATAVDGLWRMDTTAEELARITVPGDVVPENWGVSTFALGAGRFAFTTESRDACVWAYGSYAVKGNVVEWRVEDGGGISPNEFTNEPGELYRFGWSRYRDRLTLSPVRGAISPAPMRVKPWRRLDGKPSVEALAKRCRPPADALQP
jgi:TRAP-type C4-dicarboxylate transport system substrate-binding protein